MGHVSFLPIYCADCQASLDGNGECSVRCAASTTPEDYAVSDGA